MADKVISDRLHDYKPDYQATIARERKWQERNSALFWLPKLEAVPELQPHLPPTLAVPFDCMDWWPLLDGKEPNQGVQMTTASVWSCAQALGLPVFVRTDLSSAKHSGPESYRVETETDCARVLTDTFEDNALKDMAFAAQAFLVRRWLDLEAPFEAFGSAKAQLPIAREWRFFVEAGTIQCRHFYWPEDAIRYPSIPDWQPALQALAAWLPDDEAVLLPLVQRVAGVLDGAWSVDVAKDRAGHWWVIDLAEACASWHPRDCTPP